MACIDIATTLVTLMLIPEIHNAEINATKEEVKGENDDVSNFMLQGKSCEYMGKIAANGAVLLFDPVSIGVATGVAAAFNITGAMYLMSSSTESLETHVWEEGK